MVKKKLFCGLVVGALMISMCACGKTEKSGMTSEQAKEVASTLVSTVTEADKEVTAESLLNGIDSEAHKEDTMKAKMTFVTDMESTMTEGSNEKVAFKMSADIDVVGNKTASHATGNMAIDVLGMQSTQGVETYSVLEDDGTITNYSLDTLKGAWTKEVNSAGNSFDTSTYMNSMKSDYFTDLNLEETEEGYVVTGNISAGYLSDSLMDATGEYANMTSVDDEQLVFVTLTFDKDTKEVKKLVFDMGKAMGDAEKLNVKEFTVTLDILGYSKDAVEVPESVKTNAVDASELEDVETSTQSDAALDLDNTPLNKLFGLSDKPDAEEVKLYGNGSFDNASDDVVNVIVQLSTMTMTEINEKYLAKYSEQDDNTKDAIAYIVKAGWITLDETSDELTERIKNLK